MIELNGYQLNDGLTTKDAGMCQWGFAEKDGRSFFVKEFLTPKYPVDEGKLGPVLSQKMRDTADAFYAKKQAFYDRISRCRTGNIVVIQDFFRNGTKYYAVTEKVTGTLLSVKELSGLDNDIKYTFLRSFLYSMAKLHAEGIVHSDLKPDNILIKKTKANYCTAKIIDFDAGFLEETNPENVEGDLNYFSPEVIQKINGENICVTTKSDVWAIGLLLHQFWCGEIPAFSADYHYAAEAILNDSPLSLHPSLPDNIRSVIHGMLKKDPNSRISAMEAWEFISCTRGSPGESPTMSGSGKTPEAKAEIKKTGFSIPDEDDLL